MHAIRREETGPGMQTRLLPRTRRPSDLVNISMQFGIKPFSSFPGSRGSSMPGHSTSLELRREHRGKKWG